jgi:hypothetical protein
MDCNYIIWIREFYLSNTPIYKIGKTDNIIRRLKQYPKGSQLLFMCHTKNMHKAENQLKNVFKPLFEHKTDYGSEYFKGDLATMQRLMAEICGNQLDRPNDNKNQELKKIREKAANTIQKYWRSYSIQSKEKYIKIHIDKFIDLYEIKPDKTEFLKLKDINALWNVQFQHIISSKNDKFISLLSSRFGIIKLNNGNTGWEKWGFNKDIERSIKKYDKWSEFITCYLQKDDNCCIQWKDIREQFRNWNDNKFSEKISSRGDEVKKYLGNKLGDYKDTFYKRKRVRGFIGWKLIIHPHSSD